MTDIKTLKTLNDLKAVWYRKDNKVKQVADKSFIKNPGKNDISQHLKSLTPTLNSLIYPDTIRRKINHLKKN